MKKFSIIFLFLPIVVFAQQSNVRSRSEIGFMVGGSNYIGDLNQFKPYANTQLAAGLVYRYNIHSRVSFRANFNYGKVKAFDSDAKKSIVVNRNLNFESTIVELAGGVELNYFPFQLGNDRYKGTAYILAEIGIFRMNPKTNYNGEMIELQSLGTEGQGSSLNSKKPYSLTQISIPIGVGCKLSLGKKASLTFEYGIRKTFTDYLDDVGSNTYVNPDDLALENGPLSAELSNRSLDGSRYGKRGTASTKDWYTFFGAMLTFRMGKPNKCYDH
jgi:hypothetical protein